MKIITACLAALSVSAQQSPGTWAQEPNGFKGVRFGATAREPSSTVRFDSCLKATAAIPGFCTLTIPFAGFTATAYLSFPGGYFGSVTGRFPSGDFPFVKEAFIAIYGEPHRSTSTPVQTNAGARFTNESLHWTGDTYSISLEKFGSRITEGAFSIERTSDIKDGVERMRRANQNALQ